MNNTEDSLPDTPLVIGVLEGTESDGLLSAELAKKGVKVVVVGAGTLPPALDPLELVKRHIYEADAEPRYVNYEKPSAPWGKKQRFKKGRR